MFLEGAGGIVQLDTIEGRLVPTAPDRANFVVLLQSEEARDRLLLSGMIVGRERGIQLEPGDCYDFKVAPVLGGAMNAEAVQIISFVVKLHLTGQIHQQIKDVPDGTSVYLST